MWFMPPVYHQSPPVNWYVLATCAMDFRGIIGAMATISYLVRKHMNDKGITEKELAARWSVSQRAVSKYVTGEAEPSERILYRAWARNNDGFAGVILAMKMPAFRQAIKEHERR